MTVARARIGKTPTTANSAWVAELPGVVYPPESHVLSRSQPKEALFTPNRLPLKAKLGRHPVFYRLWGPSGSTGDSGENVPRRMNGSGLTRIASRAGEVWTGEVQDRG